VIFEGTETLDHHTYRRNGDHWQSFSPEDSSKEISDEIAAHLDLVEQAVATYKASGPVHS